MANLNSVLLIGRLTREPEVRTFQNGGKMASFGFAVNNRRKSAYSGQWEDEPVFLDCKAFNRETGRKLADLVEEHLHKGDQAFLAGHLTLEQWTDKEGGKRSALRIIVDDVQFLQGRRTGSEQSRPAPPPRRQDEQAPGSPDGGEEIPF